MTLPAIYREVDRTLDPERCGARPPSFAPFLRWGTWVGGDRDGNPAVTAEVTRAAMAIQTDHALRGMEAAARRIARTLSVSERDVPPSRALRRALDRDAAELPEVATELGRTLSDAPHRRKLGLAAHRLAATRLGTRGAYAGPSEFLTDIDDAATLPRGRRRAPAGVGRAATPAVAGGDVRVPPGLDGGAAALERAGDRPRGGRRGAVVPALARRRGRCWRPSGRSRTSSSGSGPRRASASS